MLILTKYLLFSLEIVFKYFFYIYYKCKKNDLQRQVLLFANLISGEEIHSIYSLLIYQLVPSVTHLLYVTVWAMYVQVRAPCVCAKARGRHWVPGCATLCLIHVRQCLSLNLCSLVLARLAGQQAPGISVPHPPSTAGAGAGGNACHVCWCSGSKAGDHTCSARALTH